MKRKDILNAILMLAQSQGFYGRLYRKLADGSQESENFLSSLEEQNFGNELDLILYIEG